MALMFLWLILVQSLKEIKIKETKKTETEKQNQNIKVDVNEDSIFSVFRSKIVTSTIVELNDVPMTNLCFVDPFLLWSIVAILNREN